MSNHLGKAFIKRPFLWGAIIGSVLTMAAFFTGYLAS